MFVFSSAAADAGLVTSRFHNTVIVAWPQHPMFAVGARPNKATPFSISAAGNVLADMAIIKRPDKTITRTRPVTSIHDRRSGWDRSQQGVGRYEIRAPPISAVLLTQSVNLARWFRHSYVALSIYFADPSCARRVSRGRHSPAVGAAILIEPGGHLSGVWPQRGGGQGRCSTRRRTGPPLNPVQPSRLSGQSVCSGKGAASHPWVLGGA